MKLYNSLAEQSSPFRVPEGPVKIYVCGITPYDTTHLGHAFTYASVDILIRYLEYLGQRVLYVQNVTDIDDDILRKAGEEGEDWRALGDRWTRHYIRDMITLNVRPPDIFPRATDVIDEIIDAVQALLAAGVAYEVSGSVYFSIDSWAPYGRLSRLPYDEMLETANERGNKPDDLNKRDPLDFVLWQAQAQGEPAWDSPWGPGRPGWHIECSTMAGRYLGGSIDIHSGGADLIFPHHESEIAQVEALPGSDSFSQFWMHVAMVHHEGEKMSKSLGNLVMVRDLLQDWSPDSLRLYLGSHHYREEWSFDESKLMEMSAVVARLCQAVTADSGDGPPINPEESKAAFEQAMDEDLDTTQAIGTMNRVADQLLDGSKSGHSIREAQVTLRQMAGIFGLRLEYSEPESRVKSGWDLHLRRFSG